MLLYIHTADEARSAEDDNRWHFVYDGGWVGPKLRLLSTMISRGWYDCLWTRGIGWWKE